MTDVMWAWNPEVRTHYVCCSPQCYENWMVAHWPASQDTTLVQDELPKTAACIHCAGCGDLITAPDDCPLHADGCPSVWAEQGAQFFMAQRALRVAMRKPIPDASFERMRDVLELNPRAPWLLMVRHALRNLPTDDPVEDGQG